MYSFNDSCRVAPRRISLAVFSLILRIIDLILNFCAGYGMITTKSDMFKSSPTLLGMVIDATTEMKETADSHVTTARIHAHTHRAGAEQTGRLPGG